MRGAGFLAGVLVTYAWLFPWLPALRSPNELSRLYQTRAIVDDHSLSVNQQIARRGMVGDLSVKDGRYYPNKAPGLSFAAVPAYAALKLVRGGAEGVSDRAGIFFLRLLVCMVAGAIAAERMRRILLRRYGPPLALAGATILALGTIMWPYSTLFMSHGPAAAALVACWYYLDRAREHPDSPAPVRRGRMPHVLELVEVARGNYALAGFFAGMALLFEYTSAVGLLALAAYGLAGARHKGRAAIHALAGFLPFALALGLYHRAAFGSAFATGYAYLVNPTFQAWHGRGFLGVGAPSLGALVASFVAPSRGLFAYSPFLALALPGLWLLWQRDRALAMLSGSALVLYGAFTASYTFEAWGWTVGPRHITPLAAFLTPPAMEAAEWLRARGLGLFAAALALASIGGMAVLMAAGPYLPEELSNPVHQLSLPLLAQGFHAHTLLGMLLHTASSWTLLPWLALLVPLGLRAALAFVPHGPSGVRNSSLAGAAALASVLFLAGATVGGPDRYEGTRRFMEERWEPVAGNAPGVLAGP